MSSIERGGWDESTMMAMMTMILAAAATMQAEVALPATADAAETAPRLPGWMAGCWMTAGEGSRTEECWTVPRGTMMLASSHTFSNGASRWFEHMRIIVDHGTLVFIAQPGGAPPTRFPMVGTATPDDPADGVMFQNLANDYPQRIHYWVDADGQLIGEISLADGSRSVRWTFLRAGASGP